MKAKVYSQDILIGLADLKIGDYHMGGLLGEFIPNEYYIEHIQKKIQRVNELTINGVTNKDYQEWSFFDFKVELVNGYILEPVGGITIDDIYEIFDEPLQLTLAGVACDIIDEYFHKI